LNALGVEEVLAAARYLRHVLASFVALVVNGARCASELICSSGHHCFAAHACRHPVHLE